MLLVLIEARTTPSESSRSNNLFLLSKGLLAQLTRPLTCPSGRGESDPCGVLAFFHPGERGATLRPTRRLSTKYVVVEIGDCPEINFFGHRPSDGRAYREKRLRLLGQDCRGMCGRLIVLPVCGHTQLPTNQHKRHNINLKSRGSVSPQRDCSSSSRLQRLDLPSVCGCWTL